jgi:hypothetical protein
MESLEVREAPAIVGWDAPRSVYTQQPGLLISILLTAYSAQNSSLSQGGGGKPQIGILIAL